MHRKGDPGRRQAYGSVPPLWTLTFYHVLHPLQPDLVSHFFTEDVWEDASELPPAPPRGMDRGKGAREDGEVFTQEAPTEIIGLGQSQPTLPSVAGVG